ncbi:LuxR C-terminal-related transcriptional regulator [Ruminococcaceae bacterium OttesenSCG-928-L11]|nr:LuxR C-terminal-related transcriptional regulator [Ruminococcaceae bacterium OttesenSCG-928-L11]
MDEQLQAQQYERVLALLNDAPIAQLEYGHLAPLLDILARIPDELLRASVEACYRMAMLRLFTGDMNGVRKWQNALISHREKLAEGSEERRLLENRIFCLGIASPQGQNANFLMNLAILSHEYADAKFPLAKLSATRGFPSVLRGAKDLSALGKHYRASASIVQPLLASLLESPKGVCEAAIAEILYEQNDLNGATVETANAINAEDPEIIFAGFAVLARIGAVDATAKPPEEILDYLSSIIDSQQTGWLRPNFEALKIRFAILKGDNDAVRQWLESSDINDLSVCIAHNYYRILTKAKAYLSLGEYRSAATLLESLYAALEDDYRPLDRIECLTCSAIAFDALHSADHAMKKLEKALLQAQEFSYVRVIADNGGAVYNLLAKYVADTNPPHEDLHMGFVHKVMQAAASFSESWPNLYGIAAETASTAPQPAEEATPEPAAAPDTAVPEVELTQSELQILQLLDKGLSNNKVSKQLHIEVSTVKFHASNIYRKLDVSSRVEALNRARELGLITRA